MVKGSPGEASGKWMRERSLFGGRSFDHMGFSMVMGIPPKWMDGLFHGKSESKNG